jgi:hypothetical protein
MFPLIHPAHFILHKDRHPHSRVAFANALYFKPALASSKIACSSSFSKTALASAKDVMCET